MSVNIELPSEVSLRALAPQKTKESIFRPMSLIGDSIAERKEKRLVSTRSLAPFVPAGQSTQLIVGASPETDLSILSLAGGLYHRFGLKRVYYSAYVPVSANPLLPAITTTPPLLREHRIYQADWLLRFYGFRPDEVLSPEQPNLDESLDPKTSWALRHLDLFPLDINRASYEELLRTPGIGVLSAKRILTARKGRRLDEDDLKKLGVVMKRARYFLACKGFSLPSLDARALRRLLTPPPPPAWKTRQLSLEF